MAYLDDTGLAYFWSKIKAYIVALLAPKANDSDVVHKTGNEGISGTKTFTDRAILQGGVFGIDKTNAEEDANDLYIPVAGADQVYYTTSNSGTKLDNVPAAIDTTIESRTIRRINASDWVIDQTLHSQNGLYYRRGTSTNGGTWTDWKEFAFTDSNITGNAATATKLATARTINDVLFDGSANITVKDSTKVSKSGDTMTGSLSIRTSTVNISTISSSSRENWLYNISKNVADTVHTGNLMRLGVAQAANTKDYRITLGVSNPRAGSLPTQESIAGGTDDADASTSSCWGSIGVYYDYSKNRAYPYCYGLTTCDLSDNSSERLATNYWVRHATGNFACNAATATAFASSKAVTLTGAVTGTASSTGGWSVSTAWRSCIVGRTDSGTSNPWYKVASRKLNGGSSSYNITFYVEHANTANKSFGILRVSVSTNSDKTINAEITKFAWLANDGFAEEDFVLVCPATAEPTVELWTKVAVGYLRKRFVVISEGSATSTGLVWELFDAMSAGQEASIPTEGTQVVSAASELAGNIETATRLATARTINGVAFDGSADIVVEDSAKLPAAGGAMTGEIVSSNGLVARRNDAAYILALYGGTEAYNGGRLELYGGTRSINSGAFALTASIDSSTVTQLLGKPDGTLIWGGQPIQISSDERLKTPLAAVPDDVLDAWLGVEWGQFQFLDAVAKKGGSARLHLGLIAQHVMSVFEAHGLDACYYGILCHEVREATEDEPAVDLWMIRYAEAQVMEACCMRRENERLKKRVSDLEDRLAALELRLGSA